MLKNLSLIFILLVFAACQTDNPIDYEIKEISKSYLDAETNDAQICFSYPEFENKKASEGISKIQTAIIKLFKSHADLQSGEFSIAEMQENFINEYKEFKKEFPDSYQKWSIETKAEINFNKNNLIGITLNNYSYLGGAHPNTFIGYYHFDALTGEELNFEDFFIKEKLEEFNNFAETKFRKLKGFNESDNYESEGYFIQNGSFKLNENFIFSETGVEFSFNNYEIAAYAVGRTVIKFNFAEIKDYLKNDSFFK